MENIGHGHIDIRRTFFSYEWQKSRLTENQYKPDWNAPIPNESMLEIQGFFTIEIPLKDKFRILSFELLTNFVTADFSGRPNMGFIDVDDKSGGYISFRFGAPLYPTDWTPEAVVKLHYMENETGKKFTSHFKCRLREVFRTADTPNGGCHQICTFSIINPNSNTYHSSDQASIDGLSEVANIPITQRIQESEIEQEAAHETRSTPTKICSNCHTENPADINFCSKCGYSFSRPHAPEISQQPPPQVVFVPTSPSQAPQIQFVQHTEPVKKRGTLGKIGCTIVTIVFVLFICLIVIALFGPYIFGSF